MLVRPLQTGLAVVASIALGCGALWRVTLAVDHYRTAASILDDPSAREVEEVSALVECGLAVIFLGHAGVAAYYARRPFRLNGVVLAAIAAVAGVSIGGSLSQAPVLGTVGLVPASLLVAGVLAGYFANHPWVSTYFGVVLGSFVASGLVISELDPFVLLAVLVWPVSFALVGVGLGRIVRRRAVGSVS